MVEGSERYPNLICREVCFDLKTIFLEIMIGYVFITNTTMARIEMYESRNFVLTPKNRRFLLLTFEIVSNSPFCNNVFRRGGICLQLVTKSVDVNVHRSYVALIIAAPHNV